MYNTSIFVSISSFQILESAQYRTVTPERRGRNVSAMTTGLSAGGVSRARQSHTDTEICSKISKSNPAIYENNNRF